MIFTNARLIFPDGTRDGLEIETREGKIAAIRERADTRADGIVDLDGNYLAPGFVDLHLHGALGRDTMEASPEAFHAICNYHASGGTTSLLLTTTAAPLEHILHVLSAVRDCRSSIKQIAGVHVEGPFISKAKRGAQRTEFIRDPTPQAVEQLLEHIDLIRRITIAPELSGALEAIERFSTCGVNVSGGHSDAWDEQARSAFECGMRSITHTFNCMSSARRDGIYRKAGLLEFALSEPKITCELIADGHHVSTTLIKMLRRAKGVCGICLVTDATAGAGLPNDSKFSLGGLDCVVRDGVCLVADGSALAGSASRMIDLIRTMVYDVGLPLHEAVAMATTNPARAVALHTKGELKIGCDADFVIISPDLEVLQTFSDGEQIFNHSRRHASRRF
jgi:N-acetylglucosamine-6-phosphate deacetylase